MEACTTARYDTPEQVKTVIKFQNRKRYGGMHDFSNLSAEQLAVIQQVSKP